MKKFEMNRVDKKGNIISGYQEIVKAESSEDAITDYLYHLETAEGVENPSCECVEVDWEEKPSFIISPTFIYDENGRRLCTCGNGEPWETCSGTEEFGSDYCG